jgi:hypothetical protein
MANLCAFSASSFVQACNAGTTSHSWMPAFESEAYTRKAPANRTPAEVKRAEVNLERGAFRLRKRKCRFCKCATSTGDGSQRGFKQADRIISFRRKSSSFRNLDTVRHVRVNSLCCCPDAIWMPILTCRRGCTDRVYCLLRLKCLAKLCLARDACLCPVCSLMGLKWLGLPFATATASSSASH